MTSSTHAQYNYNRRNSSTSPYTIPYKHQNHNSTSDHGGSVAMYSHNMNNQSNSVPSLSREFVVRRISEGETGRLKEELKCEACGKGYKHISSLAKHLWEHTPEWNVTKKLLISKHQQVQLLEAASILVGMNDTQSRRNSVFQDDQVADDHNYSTSLPDFNNKIRGPKFDSQANLQSKLNNSQPRNDDVLKSSSKLPANSPTSNSYGAITNKYLNHATLKRSNSIFQNTLNADSDTLASASMPSGYLDTANFSNSENKMERKHSLFSSKSDTDYSIKPEAAPKDSSNDEEGINSPSSNDYYEYESVIGKME